MSFGAGAFAGRCGRSSAARATGAARQRTSRAATRARRIGGNYHAPGAKVRGCPSCARSPWRSWSTLAPPARGSGAPGPAPVQPRGRRLGHRGDAALGGILLAIYQPELLPGGLPLVRASGLRLRGPQRPGLEGRGEDCRHALDGPRRRGARLAFTYLLLSANAGGDVDAGLVDSLLVTEAAAAALLVNQVVKLLVGRQRPYARFGNDLGYSRSEDNLSFYSGHTSLAFSVAAATVTVASMRGYAGVGIAGRRGVHPGSGHRLPADRCRPALPDGRPRRGGRRWPHGLGHPPHLPLPQPGALDRQRRCARPPSR